jgi:hypothetical protein
MAAADFASRVAAAGDAGNTAGPVAAAAVWFAADTPAVQHGQPLYSSLLLLTGQLQLHINRQQSLLSRQAWLHISRTQQQLQERQQLGWQWQRTPAAALPVTASAAAAAAAAVLLAGLAAGCSLQTLTWTSGMLMSWICCSWGCMGCQCK